MTALFAYRSIDDDDHHRDDAGGSSSTSSIDDARSNRSVACSTITDALLHRPRKPTANGSSKIPGTPTTVRCYSEEEEEEYSHPYNLREDFLVPNIDDSPSPMARGAILRPVFRDPFPGVDADANANTNANTAYASNPTIRLHRTAAPLLSVFATRARASVLTGSKEDSVNRTDDDDDDDNAWIRYNNGNTINNTIDNNTNDDDTSKTICTNYYAKQRSRKQIRKLYGTTSSTNSNSKNDNAGGRSSSLHRKLSMTRVKDAWNTLVADRSSQSSTPASSQSGNGRRSFLPSCRSTMFYHYLRDEAETKTKSKSKTKSDRPRTRQHVSVEPPSMPSLSSPTDGKNQNHHHNANHHHTADAVPPSAATTTTTITTNSKTRWNQLVHGFRKEPSLSSPSAAALLSSSASASTSATTAAPSNSNSSDCCHQSTTLDLSTASAHTTCAETTDSGTCITAPGSLPSSPRLVALLQKGLYRCRNDEDDDEDDDEGDDDDDEEEGEDEGCEDNDHPAAGSFDFAIGRGEF